MDREIVHALLGLFDQCVAVDFPCQIFHTPVHFLQSLIYRHCAHRHRTVAYDPLSGLVDIVAGREVHKRVAAPVAAPHGLVDLFLYS